MSPLTSSVKPLVVLVEDEPSTCEVFAMALELEGFVVVPFATAEAALERLEILRPAAVLTDLTLRGMDGVQLVRALRELPAVADVPCFGWTGWDTDRLAADELALFRKVFRKPADVAAVGEAIRDAVHARP